MGEIYFLQKMLSWDAKLIYLIRVKIYVIIAGRS